MKKRIIRWKILIPVVAVLLVMTVAFILISYQTFRKYEIEDLENYAKGLTSLIAEEIIDVDRIDGYLEQGRDYPGYGDIERKLYKLREAYPDVVYLYVYQMREDGCHVVFDLNTDAFTGSEPGTVEAFFPAYEKYIPDLLAGKKVPSITSHEKYGYVLTTLTPRQCLRETQRIERELGRTSKSRHGIYHDRPIDIDLLLYGDLHLSTPTLTLPHPRMYERDFVMIPLREIME